MRRRTVGYLFRAAVSAAVLVALATRVSWPAVAGALGRTDLRWVAVAAVALLASVAVRVASFMLVTNHRTRLIDARQAAYLTLVGAAASLVVPSGMGELFKAHVAGKLLDAPEDMTVASIIDKLTSLVAVAAMGAAGALLLGEPGFALASAAACAAAALLVYAPRLIPWRLLTHLISLSPDVRRERLAEATKIPAALLTGVIALSACGWALTYTMVYACARAAGAAIDLSLMLAIGPVMTLATLLPVSLAGIGVSQATLVAMLAAYGVPQPVAAHAALLQLAASLVPPLVGGVLYGFIGSGRQASPDTASRQRRVAMLTTVFPRFPDDPTGSFILAAAQAVAETGWRVTAVAPHAPGLPPSEELNGMAVERFRYLPDSLERLGYSPLGLPAALRSDPLNILALPFFVLGFWRAARRAARSTDVLHAHWAPVGAIALAANRRTPVVVTLHGTDVALAARGRIWAWTLRFACRRAAAVIAVSRPMADAVRALVPGLPAERVVVIGNGVDPALLARSTPEAERSGVLFVGRLTESKGAFDLVRALASLPEAVSATLVGAGDPGPVERLASSLGVSDRIVLTGPLPHSETVERIARAAVLALPSHSEGCPLAVLEAAALGTSVVASCVGAIPDILGGEDWLVQPGAVEQLARQLARALSDRTAALGAAARARESVARSFTWPAVGEALAGVYEGVAREQALSATAVLRA